MPIYEYQCTSCHHKFDLLQKINDEPVKKCPECGKNKAERLVSAAGFQLKGGGWYVTDFKDKNQSKSDTKSNPTESTSGTKKGESD